ncbi:MAG: elongation factor G, partial [Gemmatimonadales bacterium]
VDSNEMSFKMAGIQAFRAVAPKAMPVLLEPVMQVEIDMPSELMGDVLGDLTPRRGQVQHTEAIGRLTRVTALVPQAELYKYSTTLHSITHGRGTHRERFHGYAEAPPHITAKVAAENADKRQSD